MGLIGIIICECKHSCLIPDMNIWVPIVTKVKTILNVREFLFIYLFFFCVNHEVASVLNPAWVCAKLQMMHHLIKSYFLLFNIFPFHDLWPLYVRESIVGAVCTEPCEIIEEVFLLLQDLCNQCISPIRWSSLSCFCMYYLKWYHHSRWWHWFTYLVI